MRRRVAGGAAARLILLVTIAGLVGGCLDAAPPTWSFATPAVGSPGPASAEPASSPSGSLSPAPSRSPRTSGWRFLGEEPCPESRFTCIRLAVPRDHLATGGPEWEVTFAIQRATGQRRGTYVVATGGPGSSGISVADSYTDEYPAALAEHYDLVYFDQRGIGLSGPIQCPAATAVYYVAPFEPQDPLRREAAIETTRTYVGDCLAEAKVATEDLPFYATGQAVEDLEAFRDYLDVEQIHLYGESYGTQYAQVYAAAHPDRIAALYLDGAVDLTLDGPSYYVEAARAAEDVLVETLAGCTADAICAADVAGGDALAAYDLLAGRLGQEPISFPFPKADGAAETRELTSADLENAAFGYLFNEADRFLLQRAIASGSRDNLVPLARLAYGSTGVDPETVVAEDDPAWSDALYYAVECQDYAYYPGAGDEAARLAAWVDGAEAAGVNRLRLAVAYYGDLPCLWWPAQPGSADRPAPIVDPPYPVFVMNATLDPVTPIVNAMRIFGRLDDAWFIGATGGPHVIFGRGEACPDDLLTGWLASGTPPPTRVTMCDDVVADPYVAVAPSTAADYEDALDLMATTEGQLFNTNDFVNRVGDEPYTMGCDFGGTLTYAASDVGYDLTLQGCAFTPGVTMTGSGASDDEAGAFALDITLRDGQLQYRRDEDGATVEGTFRGSPAG